MQTDRIAGLSQSRVTGLAVAVALATGILVGGQVDVVGALSNATQPERESDARSTLAATPLFIVSDADGLYHQQLATAASQCGASGDPLFIGGDRDGLANQAVDALIISARCDDADR